MLILRQGNIFDGLLKHIRHHSLAILLIELLQVQIKADNNGSEKIKGSARMAMYNSDGSDAENHDEDVENEGVLTS